MGRYERMYIGRSPMQNRTDFGTTRFSTPQTNMNLPHNEIAIKVPKCTKYVTKVYYIFIFLVSVQYFKFPFIHRS